MRPGTVLLVTLLVATATERAGGGHRSHPRPRPGRRHRLRSVAARLSAAGRAVSDWTPCSGVTPWELSELEEGDIMPSRPRMRTVVANQALKWPNNTLPFIIENDDFTPEQVEKIEAAAREISKLSCLRVYPVTHGEFEDVLVVTGKDGGCWSQGVGRQGGNQTVNLQPDHCLERGGIAHEFFHAIGFHHTHNSPHRDEFIRIVWDNVEGGETNEFFKKHGSEATDIGVRYDYSSLMHASRRAKSKNGMDTIDTYDPTAVIGLKLKPSRGNIQQLNKLYNCPNDVDDDDPE